MRKFIIIGDASSTNLGDPILTYCCRYIVEKAVTELGIKQYQIEVFDIANRSKNTNEIVSAPTKVVNYRHNHLIYLLRIIKELTLWYVFEQKNFTSRLRKLEITKSSVIIIAGGAFISNSLFYALRIREIIRLSEEIGCKVIFNAVGIEKTIENSRVVKYIVCKYLESESIVGFSTRDHIEDVEKITTRDKFKLLVPDAGLFASEVYSKCCVNVHNAQQCVGISVISYDAYKSIAKNDSRATKITPELLLSFWAAVIKKIQTRKISVKILTNGGAGDYEMALQLVELLKLNPSEILLPLARTPEELIKQLNSFSSVMAHRLHACIISASLGKTIVPVIWSDKVSSFAKMVDNKIAVWPDEKYTEIIADYLCYSKEVPDISKLKEQSLEFLKSHILKCL